MPQFILIVRENLLRYPMDEFELEEIIRLHVKWASDLQKRGLFVHGAGCPAEGVVIDKKNEEVVIEEIPFKEYGFGGFYIIETESLENAIKIGSECPTLGKGDRIEVRPLM